MKNCNRLKTLTRCLYSSYYTGVNCPNSITFNFVMFQSLLCLQDLPHLLTATSLLIAIATISVAVLEAEAGQSSIYATAVQSSQQVASQKWILLDSDNPCTIKTATRRPKPRHKKGPLTIRNITHPFSRLLKKTNARIWIENDQTDNSTIITDNC